MISDLSKGEDELGGKTLLVVGLGRIGSHLAGLAKAFGMRGIGTKPDPGSGGGNPDDGFSKGGVGGGERRRCVLERAAWRGASARGLRRADLSAHSPDRGTDQRADACADEAVG